VRRVLAPLLSMFMTAAERESPPSPARADIGRSPFVRLRELLGDSAPGQPAISLAVGEPQHGVPAFVGPVLAAHIDEFGRYPMNKGIDALCEAAADWLGRRFVLPRALDPVQEILVLNGSREEPRGIRHSCCPTLVWSPSCSRRFWPCRWRAGSVGAAGRGHTSSR